MQIDKDMYEYRKFSDSEKFFPTANTDLGSKPDDKPEDVERLVAFVNKQVAKRASFRRRKPINDDDTQDSINKRNERFNKKLDRFYAESTSEIKANLERGSAL
ncbi:MAG: pre-mRNA-splicing factor syf2 [Paramarteilia canceri]